MEDELNKMNDKFNKLVLENEKLKEELKKFEKENEIVIPDYDEDSDEIYCNGIVDLMMSGKLSEKQLKIAFDKLVNVAEHCWSWIPERLFKTPPGNLWRIVDGKLQFNRKKLYVSQSKWMDINELYDNGEITSIGHYFNKN
jgi:hypothetical protein